MDSKDMPFGTPAPINRRRSNNLMQRMLKETDGGAKQPDSSRKQLFQATHSRTRSVGDGENERAGSGSLAGYELGTPVPRRYTAPKVNATPATVKRPANQPSLVTPRLIKPDATAFNSS